MHEQITAERYDSWPEERCAGIEVVDGTAVARPSASKRHNRLARMLANALESAAGPEWNADTDVDVRLQDVPLTNRRPDVVVYRADTIDVTPTRPEHVLLVVEVVSPGSETTDRVVKTDQYARAGIGFYWRVEQAATGAPWCTPTSSTPRPGPTGTGTCSPASSRSRRRSRWRSTSARSDRAAWALGARCRLLLSCRRGGCETL
jgi:Uma2 family endonuclease